MYSLRDYDYTLPQNLIAQRAADPADSCNLLIYSKETGKIEDRVFNELPNLIDSNTLIVFNTSKVLKARIPISFGKNEWQEERLEMKQGEIFFLRAHDQFSFDALVRPGKKFPIGEKFLLADDISFTVEELTEDGRRLRCSQPILDVLEKYGQMPLPPYIEYDKTKDDPYQPIFANQPGSVASPTASLHFTQDLLNKLEAKGVKHAEVVLHVWLGTFKPVTNENIKEYNIHSERIELSPELFEKIAQAKETGTNILAVGTTVTRTLESLPYVRKTLTQELKQELFTDQTITFREQISENLPTFAIETYIQYLQYDPASKLISVESKLYIYPWFTFHIIDQLITNFHLPKSSLLMLVAWFVWFDEMKHVYAHAIKKNYRFYSFGDAMWVC